MAVADVGDGIEATAAACWTLSMDLQVGLELGRLGCLLLDLVVVVLVGVDTLGAAAAAAAANDDMVLVVVVVVALVLVGVVVVVAANTSARRSATVEARIRPPSVLGGDVGAEAVVEAIPELLSRSFRPIRFVMSDCRWVLPGALSCWVVSFLDFSIPSTGLLCTSVGCFHSALDVKVDGTDWRGLAVGMDGAFRMARRSNAVPTLVPVPLSSIVLPLVPSVCRVLAAFFCNTNSFAFSNMAV